LRPFLYLRDRLFLASCALYAVNRWLVKPSAGPDGFLSWWFNDLLLMPCAVPVCLWLERRLGLRGHDGPPGAAEMAFLLILWSALFEIFGPLWVPGATGDWVDVLAYAAGGVLGWAWWNRPARSLPKTLRGA
jgi:hypothetical protein